jgi:hypothetical protein
VSQTAQARKEREAIEDAFTPLQRALLVRAANTECNLLNRLYRYVDPKTGTTELHESWQNQIRELRQAIEVLDR